MTKKEKTLFWINIALWATYGLALGLMGHTILTKQYWILMALTYGIAWTSLAIGKNG